MSSLAASAGLLEPMEEAPPVTKVQRVQHSPKLERVEEESPVVVAGVDAGEVFARSLRKFVRN